MLKAGPHYLLKYYQKGKQKWCEQFQVMVNQVGQILWPLQGVPEFIPIKSKY